MSVKFRIANVRINVQMIGDVSVCYKEAMRLCSVLYLSKHDTANGYLFVRKVRFCASVIDNYNAVDLVCLFYL